MVFGRNGHAYSLLAIGMLNNSWLIKRWAPTFLCNQGAGGKGRPGQWALWLRREWQESKLKGLWCLLMSEIILVTLALWKLHKCKLLVELGCICPSIYSRRPNSVLIFPSFNSVYCSSVDFSRVVVMYTLGKRSSMWSYIIMAITVGLYYSILLFFLDSFWCYPEPISIGLMQRLRCILYKYSSVPVCVHVSV